ncbi:hypothetical protein HK098_000527, partial [Nowakowskiella sp. JEL0407]
HSPAPSPTHSVSEEEGPGKKQAFVHFLHLIRARSSQASASLPAPFSDDSGHESHDEEDHVDSTDDDGGGHVGLDPRYNNVKDECLRPHPLSHHNHKLVHLLEIIEKHRKLQGSEKEKNALSYRHAIAALISYPKPIESAKEARKIKAIGPTITAKIKQFLEIGTILEAEEIAQSPEFVSKSELMQVYGVGWKTAHDWYAKGYTSIADLKKYPPHLTPNQQIGLELYDDFQKKMTRADVEEMLAVLKNVVQDVDEELVVVPVGGYRRGKEISGDCDVVITHPSKELPDGYLRKIVELLQT